MKTYTKGGLTTVVEDNDRRIPQYLAEGWKETETTPKPKDDADERTGKAIDDVNASEDKGEKKGKGDSKTNGKGSKAAAPDKKVSDAIKANANAATEGEAVDDGLLDKGDK